MAGSVGAAIRVLRPHQWAKNALVVLPVALAPGVPPISQFGAAAIGALAFSLCASAGYVVNDVLDVDADRAHPTKCARPFASGALPTKLGPFLAGACVVGAFSLSLALLPLPFSGMLAIYLAATLAYSSWLKSKLMVDVVVLAWLYTHRVLAGGIATGVPISAWLLAFSMFMFASLAFAKRYVELRLANQSESILNRGYRKRDLEMVASMGPATGYMAVLVLCLYIDSSIVRARYDAPWLLWFIAPVIFYWISRVWFLAHRGEMQDDPVKFALRDWRSWLCVLFAGLVTLLARTWTN